MIKVLVVDDSALVRKLLGQVFAAEGDFETEVARDGREALEKLASFAPDVVTLDIHMPRMDGLACLDRIMVEHPCPVVMVSSLTAEGAESTLEALRLGAVDFVAKPTGAVSLRMHEVAPELVQKVRSAASVKLRSSARLRERVQHRIGAAARTRPERASPHSASSSRSLEVRSGQGLVLVGTSTGGPSALETLLTALPAGFPWPILVVQHMPASFTGALARRLDKICALSVTEVVQPTLVKPGSVYIGRGDADMILSRRPAGLIAMPAPSQEGYPWHPSTDRLVRTAMQQLSPSQIIGVLMTGMGDDGARAMTQLHEEGGLTIAEAEATAVVWGMPGELVKAGGADHVLPVHEIAGQLQAMVS